MNLLRSNGSKCILVTILNRFPVYIHSQTENRNFSRNQLGEVRYYFKYI